MARLHLLILVGLATAELVTARAVAAGVQGCDEGWTEFGSRCFKFFNERKTWYDAEKSCHTLKANLPSVHSLEENTFIVDLILKASVGRPDTWIGGNDAVQVGTWMWSDGSPWDFTRWISGQPDNAGHERCVHMWNNHNEWNNHQCTSTFAYICAKDAPQTSVQATPEPKPEPNPVSLTLEGFQCQCVPDYK